MGNGPSLAEVDFDVLAPFTTFGMNGAYRYYYKTGWWPNFFGCFDEVFIDTHRDAFREMIEDPDVPIQRYFMIEQVSQSPQLTVLPRNGTVGYFSDRFDTFGYGGNTGVNCCQVGVCLGYKKIIIVGVDCDYVEVVKGSEFVDDRRLKVESQPNTNPNYFFDDYQQEGDVYNAPQAHIYQGPAWQAFALFARRKGVEVVNCSAASKLQCFRKAPLEQELSVS
jgi:hypothetical protein